MNLGKLNVLFCLLLLIGIGTGCKKSNATIDNQAGTTIAVAVYRTYGDYIGETNPLFVGYAQPNGSISIPTKLLTGSTLYIDWYTFDYTHTNWNGMITFSPDSSGNTLQISDPGATILRNFCINGGGLFSTWKSIGAYTIDDTLHLQHSVWGQSGIDTFKNFTLGKDFKFVLSTKDSVGDSTGTQYLYSVSAQPDSIAFTATGVGTNAGKMFNFYGNLSATNATDTIHMQFPPDTTYYVFIKHFVDTL
jgi:hypothetical protein